MLKESIVKNQRGIGLVELMVGITIGLIVAAGASIVAVNQINEHRRLMLEIQIQQDLRTTADLLLQDLRRAGFRGTPEYSVWAPPTAVGSTEERAAQIAVANPYSSLSATDTGISYQYARPLSASAAGYDTSNAVKNNEHFGIKLDTSTHVLSLQLGNKEDGQPNWEPITDPNILRITDLQTEITTQEINVGDFCEKRCYSAASGMTPVCPVQQVREVSFKIVGEATRDRSVQRTLSGVERIRTDAITGACPA